MTSKFKKILSLSKKISKDLLKDKIPESLEKSDLFNQSDKEYIMDQLTNVERIKERFSLASQVHKKAGWNSLKVKIDLPVKKFYLKYVALVAVLILVAVTTFYFVHKSNKLLDPVVVNATIESGKDKAFLTLGNGSEIVLGKGQSHQTQNAYSDGKGIVYNANQGGIKEIVYNFLTIPRGGQFFIKLSDGTQVWLNSESQLKYPVSFKKGEVRQVELVYGEAYFDVSPSHERHGTKFKVLNQNQEVEVFGTEFNVKIYKDENVVYTTLVEGKVSVSNSSTKQNLIPNQQSKIEVGSNDIIVYSVDVYNEISWKDGVFSFEKKPLIEIMKVLSRWYDVEIIFNNNKLKNVKFYGILDKNQSIVDILDAIKKYKKIEDYKIKGKVIIIK